ncbi:MAG: hypothetical protein AAB036_02720 [Elusimicrobiota bacterium]
MTPETEPRTSRLGALLVALALGGSAVAVLGWHLLSNREASRLYSSGFDIAATPETGRRLGSGAAAVAAPASGLGMLKSEPGLRVAVPGQGPSAPAAATAATAKTNASLSLKEAAIKNERLVTAYSRRMEARYPSITQFGKDWVAAPDLRALRDQYWRDRDPLKFVYGAAKSENFGRLLKKYSRDPGVHAYIIEGFKQAPADFLGAAGQVFQNDSVAKDLASTVAKSMGLPSSLSALLGGQTSKAPDQNQILSDIMKSPDVQKALQDQRR